MNVFKTNRPKFDITNPLDMAIRDFMTLGIGGRRHIQPDFAVTKLITVLIFAIFCPEGIARGLDKASIAANFSIGWLGGNEVAA